MKRLLLFFLLIFAAMINGCSDDPVQPEPEAITPVTWQRHTLLPGNSDERVMALSASLQQLISQSDVSDALRESEVSLNFYLSAADRYAATFDEAIELAAQLATDESGAQARLAQHSASLHDTLQGAGAPDLMLLYREMQSFEKDYLVTRQRPFMQSAFNVAGLLREAISSSPDLDGEEQAQALARLDDYLTVAEEMLLLDVEL